MTLRYTDDPGMTPEELLAHLRKELLRAGYDYWTGKTHLSYTFVLPVSFQALLEEASHLDPHVGLFHIYNVDVQIVSDWDADLPALTHKHTKYGKELARKYWFPPSEGF